MIPEYATGLRHFEFAKYLIKKGYNVTIFAASTKHNTNINLINDNRSYVNHSVDGVQFIFIKTRNYKGNGKQRILNMFDYYRGLLKVTKHCEIPGVIVGSSVHPLACLAAIKLSKKFKCECICEIRDLWPETFVAYNFIKANNPLLKLLYFGEKWIYQKANKVIFTMEGGKDYIIEKGWSKKIDLQKIFYINNGVDLESFNYNKEHNKFADIDLDDHSKFKVLYTGSIRLVNQVGLLLEAAKVLKNKNINDILFLVYGDGDELENLKNKAIKEGLTNVIFKGSVKKEFIPYITSCCQLNIILGKNNPIYRFGISMRKMFDYFASGKPLLSTLPFGYSLIKRFDAGIEMNLVNSEELANNILYFKNMDPEKYNKYCNNALSAAKEFSTEKLAEKFQAIIDGRDI